MAGPPPLSPMTRRPARNSAFLIVISLVMAIIVALQYTPYAIFPGGKTSLLWGMLTGLIIGGLIFSQALTLYTTPVIYLDSGRWGHSSPRPFSTQAGAARSWRSSRPLTTQPSRRTVRICSIARRRPISKWILAHAISPNRFP